MQFSRFKHKPSRDPVALLLSYTMSSRLGLEAAAALTYSLDPKRNECPRVCTGRHSTRELHGTLSVPATPHGLQLLTFANLGWRHSRRADQYVREAGTSKDQMAPLHL